MWDLEAEATRLNLKLDELPMDQKGWDRAVNVAYRKAALRAHPDKHPPDQRDAAEANFKRLNEANKIMLRVGKTIREARGMGDGLTGRGRGLGGGWGHLSTLCCFLVL